VQNNKARQFKETLKRSSHKTNQWTGGFS